MTQSSAQGRASSNRLPEFEHIAELNAPSDRATSRDNERDDHEEPSKSSEKKPVRFKGKVGVHKLRKKTRNQKRNHFDWVCNMTGQPTEEDVLEQCGPGHYQLRDEYGNRKTYKLVRLEEIMDDDEDAAEPEPDGPSLDERVAAATAAAVQRSMGSIIQQFAPLIQGFKAESAQAKDAAAQTNQQLAEQLAATQAQLQAIQAKLAEQPAPQQTIVHNPKPSLKDSLMEKAFEKFLERALSKAAEDDDDDDDDADDDDDSTNALVETLKPLVQQGAMALQMKVAEMSQRKAPAAVTAPRAPQEHQVQPTQAPAQQPQHQSVRTLPGMTPEIESELRQMAQELGYDYDEVLAQTPAGWTAEAALTYARSYKAQIAAATGQ